GRCATRLAGPTPPGGGGAGLLTTAAGRARGGLAQPRATDARPGRPPPAPRARLLFDPPRRAAPLTPVFPRPATGGLRRQALATGGDGLPVRGNEPPAVAASRIRVDDELHVYLQMSSQ